MNRQVDPSTQERLVELASEEALAADLVKGLVEVLVTDGPFTESKEWIAGYDVIEAADLDEAIEIASKHPMARFGRIELRPVWPL